MPRDKLTSTIATDLATILLNTRYQNKRGPPTNTTSKKAAKTVVHKQLQHKLRRAQTEAGIDRD